MSANLKNALEKLGKTPVEDLPDDAQDPLWEEIRETLSLSLWELSALKNYSTTEHINRCNAVFILYEGTDEGPNPIGTAFAVSNSLLMTAAQNVVFVGNEKIGDQVYLNLRITPMIFRAEDGAITAEGKIMPVTLFKYHSDWAFLRVTNQDRLEHYIPLATEPNELPPRATLENVYVYYSPLRIFRDAEPPFWSHPFVKSVEPGTITKHSIFLPRGGFSGSSGGPYIFRNKVIALHVNEDDISVLYTGHKGKPHKLERVDRQANVASENWSTAALPSKMSPYGIILQEREAIMKIYKREVTRGSA